MAGPGAARQDGSTACERSLRRWSFAYLVSLLLLGCIAFALVREMRKANPRPAGLRGHIRARGWGLLLLPVALMAAVMTGHVHAAGRGRARHRRGPGDLGPAAGRQGRPYAVLALAVFGLILAKAYHDGFSSQVLYGLVLAGAGSFGAASSCRRRGCSSSSACGCSCGCRRRAPGWSGRWPPAGSTSGRGGISGAQALLLIPVAGLAMQLLGPGNWFGVQAINGLDVALIDLTVAAAALVLVFRSRAWAATLAAAGLLVLGAYGWLIAAFWPVGTRVRVTASPTCTRPGALPRSGSAPCEGRPPAGPGSVAGAAR